MKGVFELCKCNYFRCTRKYEKPRATMRTERSTPAPAARAIQLHRVYPVHYIDNRALHHYYIFTLVIIATSRLVTSNNPHETRFTAAAAIASRFLNVIIVFVSLRDTTLVSLGDL